MQIFVRVVHTAVRCSGGIIEYKLFFHGICFVGICSNSAAAEYKDCFVGVVAEEILRRDGASRSETVVGSADTGAVRDLRNEVAGRDFLRGRFQEIDHSVLFFADVGLVDLMVGAANAADRAWVDPQKRQILVARVVVAVRHTVRDIGAYARNKRAALAIGIAHDGFAVYGEFDLVRAGVRYIIGIWRVNAGFLLYPENAEIIIAENGLTVVTVIHIPVMAAADAGSRAGDELHGTQIKTPEAVHNPIGFLLFHVCNSSFLFSRG